MPIGTASAIIGIIGTVASTSASAANASAKGKAGREQQELIGDQNAYQRHINSLNNQRTSTFMDKQEKRGFKKLAQMQDDVDAFGADVKKKGEVLALDTQANLRDDAMAMGRANTKRVINNQNMLRM